MFRYYNSDVAGHHENKDDLLCALMTTSNLDTRYVELKIFFSVLKINIISIILKGLPRKRIAIAVSRNSWIKTYQFAHLNNPHLNLSFEITISFLISENAPKC